MPAALRQYWGGRAGARDGADASSRASSAKVTVDAKTVAEALASLGSLSTRVLDDTGALRQHVHVFLNQRAVKDIGASVSEGDIIHILPAVSGGSTA